VIDTTVTYKRIQDESLPQFDGSVKHYKRFDLFIGQHGPFVERFDRDTYTPLQLEARVRELKHQLQNLPT